MKKILDSLTEALRPAPAGSRREEVTVIFLHIPKTAGTAVRDIIRKNYRKNEVYDFPDVDAREAMDQFSHLPETQRNRYRAVLGHMWYGLHKAVPRPSTYVTLLRDPVDRVVSHYHFVRTTPGHYLYRTVTDREMSLGDYVSSGISTELDNGQTRLVSGARDEERYPFGGCSEELLGRACENLQNRFSVVGLQERFRETLQLFENLLGWKTLDGRKNVTRNRPPVEDLSILDQETIEKHNSLDRRLYQFAGKLFEKQLGAGGTA